jgi:hypothetical protein
MSASGDSANNPTMIIPRGTEIRINSNGQLSIRTPGNLVIQNSGTYSELESTQGSIRIEDNVSVEAVSVRAAQACFIQGTLTAWRVHAKKIALEDRAKAYIMLQESEQLELSKGSRLVGNFANEKEIFLMMGKFTTQLKELPGNVDMNSPTPLGESRAIPTTATPTAGRADRAQVELPEPLRQAMLMMEREIRRPELDAHSAEVLREVVFSLRERNIPRTEVVYRDAFAEIAAPSDTLRQAYELLERYFSQR